MTEHLPAHLSEMERLPAPEPPPAPPAAPEPTLKTAARRLLGGALVFAGVSHLTFARRGFRAQVPNFVPRFAPVDKDDTVVYSGFVEIALGSAILLANERQRAAVGKVAAAFFVAVFPGNVAQYVHHRSALGLDTERKRFVRLFFQPVLVAWALLSTQDEPATGDA